MNFTFTMPDGSQRECKIGYSIAIEAAKRIREYRAAEWKNKNDLIATNFPEGDAKKEALLAELKTFFETQIPSEEEVRAWCFEPEGQLFCFSVGSSLSGDSAKNSYNSLNEDQLLDLWHSLWVVFRGKSQADAIKKERQIAAEADKARQDVEYVERQEVISIAFLAHRDLGIKKFREVIDEVIVAESEVGHETVLAELMKLTKKEKAATNEPLPGQKELF